MERKTKHSYTKIHSHLLLFYSMNAQNPSTQFLAMSCASYCCCVVNSSSFSRFKSIFHYFFAPLKINVKRNWNEGRYSYCCVISCASSTIAFWQIDFASLGYFDSCQMCYICFYWYFLALHFSLLDLSHRCYKAVILLKIISFWHSRQLLLYLILYSIFMSFLFKLKLNGNHIVRPQQNVLFMRRKLNSIIFNEFYRLMMKRKNFLDFSDTKFAINLTF